MLLRFGVCLGLTPIKDGRGKPCFLFGCGVWFGRMVVCLLVSAAVSFSFSSPMAHAMRLAKYRKIYCFVYTGGALHTNISSVFRKYQSDGGMY